MAASGSEMLAPQQPELPLADWRSAVLELACTAGVEDAGPAASTGDPAGAASAAQVLLVGADEQQGPDASPWLRPAFLESVVGELAQQQQQQQHQQHQQRASCAAGAQRHSAQQEEATWMAACGKSTVEPPRKRGKRAASSGTWSAEALALVSSGGVKVRAIASPAALRLCTLGCGTDLAGSPCVQEQALDKPASSTSTVPVWTLCCGLPFGPTLAVQQGLTKGARSLVGPVRVNEPLRLAGAPSSCEPHHAMPRAAAAARSAVGQLWPGGRGGHGRRPAGRGCVPRMRLASRQRSRRRRHPQVPPPLLQRAARRRAAPAPRLPHHVSRAHHQLRHQRRRQRSAAGKWSVSGVSKRRRGFRCGQPGGRARRWRDASVASQAAGAAGAPYARPACLVGGGGPSSSARCGQVASSTRRSRATALAAVASWPPSVAARAGPSQGRRRQAGSQAGEPGGDAAGEAPAAPPAAPGVKQTRALVAGAVREALTKVKLGTDGGWGTSRLEAKVVSLLPDVEAALTGIIR